MMASTPSTCTGNFTRMDGSNIPTDTKKSTEKGLATNRLIRHDYTAQLMQRRENDDQP
ncbi:hypothetical protein CNE_BB1p03690 (plasmid) [Cupriavidus necator N-1]|uniref:Uncharacterized protein n=1 Tax=Cupriavidus necator (strain ATCC 43291 / DSM 13513 / CCUG 52238 / LMG 8453 / N-1) TaxID=1042878 RepID=F8GWS3_CUPNN|nr:hypothetical protein CNE_BB1p03690 [Cupriavidus necator N-1]